MIKKCFLSFKNKSLWKKVLILALIFLGSIYVLTLNMQYTSFNDFQGPEYLPPGFNVSDNYTSSNERIFEYHGNGTFYTGVVKNASNNKLERLIEPFKEDSENIKKPLKT